MEKQKDIMANKLVVAPAPHVQTSQSTARIMRDVVIALMPALVVSMVVFGVDVLRVTALSVACCVLFEYLIQRFLVGGSLTIGNWSAVKHGVAPDVLGVQELLLGNMPGSLGEVAALALICGFVYLLWRRVITWQIPVSVLGTMAVFAFVVALASGSTGPVLWQFPLFHVLAGGALLGAIFMATDYSTSPMTVRGGVIFGIGIGAITMCIRLWGAYPEGMSFAILIMNACVPLINKYVKPKRFGVK